MRDSCFLPGIFQGVCLLFLARYYFSLMPESQVRRSFYDIDRKQFPRSLTTGTGALIMSLLFWPASMDFEHLPEDGQSPTCPGYN